MYIQSETVLVSLGDRQQLLHSFELLFIANQSDPIAGFKYSHGLGVGYQLFIPHDGDYRSACAGAQVGFGEGLSHDRAARRRTQPSDLDAVATAKMREY